MLIHGWVQVPRAITGSVDGLMVIDSLAGEALALRCGATSGWQEFSLLRAARSSGALVITFALTGVGEALLDDVTIQAISRPAVSSSSEPPASAGGYSSGWKA